MKNADLTLVVDTPDDTPALPCLSSFEIQRRLLDLGVDGMRAATDEEYEHWLATRAAVGTVTP